ncbi:DDX54 (predicted), partial [Pycnogonum litorale]
SIEGFDELPDRNKSGSDDECNEMRHMVIKQNRKNKKSGGFQSMGLSRPVYRAILLKGYKVPTPIQRKCIPVVMDGQDVVAMARTGSGKTAAFLVPMFERLKVHSAQSGARALILSPTRELALQTLKFTKELGKFCGIKSIVILGGDSMEDQFECLHANPDIIIATPGRFLHVLVEMDLKLNNIEYVVFDEADRLFEMGFLEQLRETLHRLPDNRQTVLFSATLPKSLIDFAKAGLNNPTLIRLDVDSKLSSTLKLSFFMCRSDDKLAVLLHVLRSLVKSDEMTVIFAATKHHVEYLKDVLLKAGISCTYIYSSLDHSARKINIAKFQTKQCNVLLVTDIAARGIDIPLLDNVINYNFPAKSKLFIHRVGRVARAGRNGHAYSLISPDESSYVLDLHLFLGRPLTVSSNHKSSSESDGVVGCVPQAIIDGEDDLLKHWHQESSDLKSMKSVCNNAYKLYLKSRPAASTESIKRCKQLLDITRVPHHPIFAGDLVNDSERQKLIRSIKAYRPSTTIFEVTAGGKMSSKVKKSQAYQVMKEKRNYHGKIVESVRDTVDRCDDVPLTNSKLAAEDAANESSSNTKLSGFKDDEFYIPYQAADHHSERGLSISSASKFERDADSAVLDLTGDDDRTLKKNKSLMKWDKKRKRYVNETGRDTKAKRIKTESGVWIPATYKSDRYKQWKDKQKKDYVDDDNLEGEESDGDKKRDSKLHRKNNQSRRVRMKDRKSTQNNKPPRRELKTNEQILKARNKNEKLLR